MGANAFTYRNGYNGTLEERMEAKTIKTPGGCWIWNGSLDSDGYGLIKVNGHNRHANRIAYELKYGAIPEGQIILHSCDVPVCVNPDHLKAGTYKDNMQDMYQKGRNRNVRGEKHHRSKLTEKQVKEIRSIQGRVNFSALGRLYGVSRTTITRILRGQSWKVGGDNGNAVNHCAGY